MTPSPLFRGVAVALLTLFDDADRVDVSATTALAVDLVAAGVAAVVVAGSTGEAAALDACERVALLEAITRELRPSGVPVIAGTGASDVNDALRYTCDALDVGVDGLLALAPPGGADVERYYETLAVAADVTPLLAYHHPGLAPPGIPVSLLADLPVAGCKDSSGDADRLVKTLDEWGGSVFVGSSALVAIAGALGAPGMILALANVEPELCASAFAGDQAAARALIQPHEATRVGIPPSGVKQLAARRWGTSTRTRLR